MNLDRIKDKTRLTFEQASELWRADPLCGTLHWRPASGRRGVAGAGRLSERSAYHCVAHDGSNYKVHRLMWLLCTGAWPEFVIDHINGNRHDNRLANLRDVPHRINQLNQRFHRAGTRRDGSPILADGITFAGFESRLRDAGITSTERYA